MSPVVGRRFSRGYSVLRFTVALLAIAAVGPLALSAENAPREQTSPAGARAPANGGDAACKKDADCVVVPDDCCSCAEGGKQHAVAKKQKNALEKARKKRCAGTMCPQMMSPDPSCTQHAVCSAGACVLADTAPPVPASAPAAPAAPPPSKPSP